MHHGLVFEYSSCEAHFASQMDGTSNQSARRKQPTDASMCLQGLLHRGKNSLVCLFLQLVWVEEL